MTHHTVDTDTARWDLPLDAHPKLEVETEFARLTIVPIEPGEVPYLEIQGRDAANMRVDVTGEDGTTRLRVGGGVFGEPWWGGKWWDGDWWEKRGRKKGHRARLIAHVPPSVRAQIRATAAKIMVERLSGCELDVATDAGQISLDDVDGQLKIRTDAGKIEGRRLRGSIDVEADMGAVHLEVLSLLPGKHSVRADMGSVRVELARGLPIRIDARTSMGATRVDFPSLRDADTVLDVEADLGAIRVCASSETWEAPAPRPKWKPSAPTAPPDAGVDRSYRSAEVLTAAPDAGVEQVLSRVASGSLSPADAREILRAMGWT